MNIDVLIKKATLEKNGSAKEAYKDIKSELLLNKTSKNPKPEGKVIHTIEDLEITELDLQIIRKLIQQKEESISMYEANSRKEFADIYKEQLKYLKELLPPEISEDKIVEIITNTYPDGFTNKEIGKIMQMIKNEYPSVNKKKASEIIKRYVK